MSNRPSKRTKRKVREVADQHRRRAQLRMSEAMEAQERGYPNAAVGLRDEAKSALAMVRAIEQEWQ